MIFSIITYTIISSLSVFGGVELIKKCFKNNNEDTIDIKIQKALRTKMNIANDVMGEELKSWI